MPGEPQETLARLLQFSEQVVDCLLGPAGSFRWYEGTPHHEKTGGRGLAAFLAARTSSSTTERIRREAPVVFVFASLQPLCDSLEEEYLALADENAKRLYIELTQTRAGFESLSRTSDFDLAGAWLVKTAGLEDSLEAAFQHPSSRFLTFVLADFNAEWVYAGDPKRSEAETIENEPGPVQEPYAGPGCLSILCGLVAAVVVGSLLAKGILELTALFRINLEDSAMLLYFCAIGTTVMVYIDQKTPWRKRVGQGAFYLAVIVLLIVLYPYRPDWVRWLEEVLNLLPPLV